MINDTTGEMLVSLVRDWNWFWFFNNKPGQIRAEEIAKQPTIENIKINAPGEQTVLYPAGESVGAPLDVCRFVKVQLTRE